MKNTAQQLQDLASFFDSQGKPEAPIHVQGTRDYLRSALKFKPKKRGGPLYFDTHPLVIVPPDQAPPVPETLPLFVE